MIRWLPRILVIFPAFCWGDDLARKAIEVLSRNCIACHGEPMRMSKLDLRSRESIAKGGERGPALVPGDAERSRLYRFAAGIEQPSMPPGKKLADEDLRTLREWIEDGANFAEPVKADAHAAVAALEEHPVTDEDRRFWAFQAPRAHVPPSVAGAGWVRNPVDAFVLAALESKSLAPSPRADPRALVRRAYLDLLGLPPEPAEVEAFVQDNSPEAWDRLVDKLLASPHYGERWGRHWLDLVRYADSAGYEFDRDRPNAWRYRDYVIRAFNRDKPYDRFLREQIAGDEMEFPTVEEKREAIVATGFLRHGPEANIKTEQTRMDELDDIIATTTGAFLGMTVGCARCHNHKFDPIPQKDYYRIQAVFFPSKYNQAPLVSEERVAEHKTAAKRIDDLQTPWKKQRDELREPYRRRLLEEKKAKLPDYIQLALRTPPEKRTGGQKLNASQVEKTLRVEEKELLAAMSAGDLATLRDIDSRIQTLDAERPAPLPTALAVKESGPKPEPSYFLHRGSPGNKGSLMKPGVLTVAAKSDFDFPGPPEAAASSLRRRAFAEWLASAENPLTARVMANRIWQHHFGEGIVATPSNFGDSGGRPSHPELLDWLAAEFVKRGWSVKAMHRLIMTSNAYQMASDDRPDGLQADPSNVYLWRMARRKLEGELIRDSILAVAGTLDRKQGGPGIFPYIDPALWSSSSGRTWPGRPDNDPETWRRSVYIHSKRTIPVPMLEVFDKPDTIGSCARRNRSTVPTQALILMNSAFVDLQSRHFAQRLQREAGSVGSQVDRAFQLAFGRPPSPAEKVSSTRFAESGPHGLVDFCRAIFNLNEFVYIP
ncbi:MAG: PSD1 and planctomycete cytochrome C domain-containing protein [Bryobacteraceae bacterium]